MAVQKWTTMLSLYFIMMFVIVTLFSIAAQSNSGVVTSSANFAKNEYGFNSTGIPTSTLGKFDWSIYFKDLFSFFLWNINLYDNDHPVLMEYFWVFRIFVVYLPLLALIYSLWYSVPTVSG